MNMLAKHVGRRKSPKIINVQCARDEVCRRVDDAFAGSGTEKQRLRGTFAGEGVLNILLEDSDTSLGIVPTCLVDRQVQLYVSGSVGARQRIVVKFFRTGISIGGASLGSAAAVDFKQHTVSRIVANPIGVAAGKAFGFAPKWRSDCHAGNAVNPRLAGVKI